MAYVQQTPSAETAEEGDLGMAYALPEGFVYLDVALPGIAWDAKYAGSDNFTGRPVDGYSANRIALAEKMSPALEEAARRADAQGYSLLVYDAARPQRAVDRFVLWAAEPEDDLTREAHYPKLRRSQLFEQGYVARKSGHSRGAAIDLTLVDQQSGEALDMGGIFDLMDAKSHHGAKGLTNEQQQNRRALKQIMEQSGFSAYTNEWWHYALNGEPFPGQYFDFVIGPAGEGEDVPEMPVFPANPMAERE